VDQRRGVKGMAEAARFLTPRFSRPEFFGAAPIQQNHKDEDGITERSERQKIAGLLGHTPAYPFLQTLSQPLLQTNIATHQHLKDKKRTEGHCQDSAPEAAGNHPPPRDGQEDANNEPVQEKGNANHFK